MPHTTRTHRWCSSKKKVISQRSFYTSRIALIALLLAISIPIIFAHAGHTCPARRTVTRTRTRTASVQSDAEATVPSDDTMQTTTVTVTRASTQTVYEDGGSTEGGNQDHPEGDHPDPPAAGPDDFPPGPTPAPAPGAPTPSVTTITSHITVTVDAPKSDGDGSLAMSAPGPLATVHIDGPDAWPSAGQIIWSVAANVTIPETSGDAGTGLAELGVESAVEPGFEPSHSPQETAAAGGSLNQPNTGPATPVLEQGPSGGLPENPALVPSGNVPIDTSGATSAALPLVPEVPFVAQPAVPGGQNGAPQQPSVGETIPTSSIAVVPSPAENLVGGHQRAPNAPAVFSQEPGAPSALGASSQEPGASNAPTSSSQELGASNAPTSSSQEPGASNAPAVSPTDVVYTPIITVAEGILRTLDPVTFTGLTTSTFSTGLMTTLPATTYTTTGAGGTSTTITASESIVSQTFTNMAQFTSVDQGKGGDNPTAGGTSDVVYTPTITLTEEILRTLDPVTFTGLTTSSFSTGLTTTLPATSYTTTGAGGTSTTITATESVAVWTFTNMADFTKSPTDQEPGIALTHTDYLPGIDVTLTTEQLGLQWVPVSTIDGKTISALTEIKTPATIIMTGGIRQLALTLTNVNPTRIVLTTEITLSGSVYGTIASYSTTQLAPAKTSITSTTTTVYTPGLVNTVITADYGLPYVTTYTYDSVVPWDDPGGQGGKAVKYQKAVTPGEQLIYTQTTSGLAIQTIKTTSVEVTEYAAFPTVFTQTATVTVLPSTTTVVISKQRGDVNQEFTEVLLRTFVRSNAQTTQTYTVSNGLAWARKREYIPTPPTPTPSPPPDMKRYRKREL